MFYFSVNLVKLNFFYLHFIFLRHQNKHIIIHIYEMYINVC